MKKEEIQKRIKWLYGKYEDQVSEGDLTKEDFKKIEAMLMEVSDLLNVKLF